MSFPDLKKQVFAEYKSPFADRPPPLKQAAAAAVAEELGMLRGDPAEKRHLEEQLIQQKERVAEMEKMLKKLKTAISTSNSVVDLKNDKIQVNETKLLAENAVLKSTNETFPENAEELFKLVSKEKAALHREREALSAERRRLETERREFDNERRILINASTGSGARALQNISPTLTMGSVIAHKVAQYMTTLDGCTKQELAEIRLGLEEMLTQKLNDLEN